MVSDANLPSAISSKSFLKTGIKWYQQEFDEHLCVVHELVKRRFN